MTPSPTFTVDGQPRHLHPGNPRQVLSPDPRIPKDAIPPLPYAVPTATASPALHSHRTHLVSSTAAPSGARRARIARVQETYGGIGAVKARGMICASNWRMVSGSADGGQVHDVSGGCGSMYAIEIASQRFKGLNMMKQHRMVNEVLAEEIRGWHGVQLKTEVE